MMHKMNTAERAAAFVLDLPDESDLPRYPPPGLGGARISRQEVLYPAPQDYYYSAPQEDYYVPDQRAIMKIHANAPEWVPSPVAQQSLLDSSVDEAKRILTQAFAFARRAKDVAEEATNAAKIATDAASSAFESVEKAANIVRDLQRMNVREARSILPGTASAILTAARSLPAATRPLPAATRPQPAATRPQPATTRPVLVATRIMPVVASLTNSSAGGARAPLISPIVAPGKVRHGTKDCFEKQQGRPCKPNNGKPCKWCK